MKQIVQTKSIVTPLRFDVCNSVTRDYVNTRKKERNTINATITKKTRPVFADRVNPDTPPTITDSVRELASLIRNNNEIRQHFTYKTPITADFDVAALNMKVTAEYNDAPIFTKRYGDPSKTRPRPLWICEAALADGKNFGRIYTAESNVNTNDKPAFRHDSLFLFDTLSEEY